MIVEANKFQQNHKKDCRNYHIQNSCYCTIHDKRKT